MSGTECQHRGSGMWYRRAESRMDGGWGRERGLEWIEHCAQIGWWTLLEPAKEWTWSEGMYRLHGADPHAAALRHGAEAIVDHVVREERERARTGLAALDHAGSVRQGEVRLDYWVPSGATTPRRIHLVGQLEPISSGRVSWIGCAQDITDIYLSARAQAVLMAAEEALSGWRSFVPGTEQLLAGLAPSLDAPTAVAWIRGANGRLEARTHWSASGRADCDLAQPAPGSALIAQHRSLARTVWATRGPAVAARGFGIPATWRGQTVAALTFKADGVAYLDERLDRVLRWLAAALGRQLTGDRPEFGETRLSDREREVLQLAADGCDGPAIARQLFVSPATREDALPPRLREARRHRSGGGRGSRAAPGPHLLAGVRSNRTVDNDRTAWLAA